MSLRYGAGRSAANGRKSKSCLFCKNWLNSITRTRAEFLENPNTRLENLHSGFVLQAAWSSGEVRLARSGALGEGSGNLKLGGRMAGSKQKEGLPGTQARGIGGQHTGSSASVQVTPEREAGARPGGLGALPRSADAGLHTQAVQGSLASGLRVWVVFNLSEPQSLPL